jgi:hypothetical protein
MARSIQIDVDVSSFKPALDVLRYVDRDLYKKVVADIKTTATPLATKVGSDFPVRVLSGFTGKKTKKPAFPRYNASEVRKSVKPIVGGRKRQSTNTYPILKLRTKSPAAQIFDLAQNQQTPGNTFVANLKDNGYGNASRVMWKSTRRNMPMVVAAIDKAVKLAEAATGAKLAANINKREKNRAFAKTQTRTQGRFGLN